MKMAWLCVALAVAGCAKVVVEDEVINEYRIGQSLDANQMAAKIGWDKPDEVKLDNGYSFYECQFDRNGSSYTVEISKDNKIIGLWAIIPSSDDRQEAQIAAYTDQMKRIYADKLECCGAAKSEVVADLHYGIEDKHIFFSICTRMER